MRAKSHDIQWPVTAKTLENINTNFDALFESLNTFEKSVASSKNLHELLSDTHSDTIKANRLRGDLIIAQGAVPEWARLAKGTLAYVLTMGANEPAWASPNHAVLSAIHTDALAAAVVRGDVMIGNATPNWSRLAKGTATYVLTAGASDVSWATPNHALLSGTHTDALAAAVIRGDVLIGNATPNWSRLAKGTSGFVLTAGASDVSWATPNHNLLSAIHADSTTASAVRGDLIVAQGVSPLWTRLAKGTAAHVLTMGADEPAWAVIPTQTSALLSAVHTDTTPAAVVRGDIIVGIGVSPTWTRLAKGTAGYVLTMGADEPAWATPAAPAAHQLDGALHTVSGLTTGHFLKATGATTFAFGAHGLAYGDVGAAAASHVHAWGDITSGVPTTWTPIAHDILSAYHGDTTAAAVVRGDLIIGSGATPKWTRLAIGTAGYLLKAGANEPAWGTLASTDLSDTTNLARLNAANSFTLINPLTTIAESWIGPSSTAGIYFKGGNVGIGTTGPEAILETNVANSDYANTKTGAGAVFTSTESQSKIILKADAKLNLIRGDSAGNLVLTPDGGNLDLYSKMRILSAGNVSIGFTDALAKVAINGGLHVGGESDPGDNNLLVDGGAQISALGAFVAADKYVVVDASGNLHVSTLGPLA